MNNKEIIRQQILGMLFRILQKPLIYDNDDNESYDSTELVKCGSFSLQLFSKEHGILGLNMLSFFTF